MRHIIPVTLGIIILGFIVIPNEVKSQIVQSCGQSVVIFGDGSIVISGWKSFSPAVMAPNSPIPSVIKESLLEYPSKIEFKKDLLDKTKVCLEDELGSHCITLGAIRKVK